MANLKNIKNKYLSSSDGEVLGVDTNTENISALSFKIATADSLSKFNLVDGFSDDYNDTSGVEASASTGGRNAAGNYYSGAVSTPVTVTKNSGDADVTIDTSDIDEIAASMWGSGGETGASSSGGAGGYVKVTVDTSSIDSVLLRVGTVGGTDSGAGGSGPGGSAGDGGSLTGLFDGSYLRANSLAIAAGGGGGTKSVGSTGPGGKGDATGAAGGGPTGGGGGNISSFSGGAGWGGHESGGGHNEGGGGGSGYNSGSGGGGSDPSDYAGGGGGGSNYAAASETTQVHNESAGDSNSTGDSNFNSSYGGSNEGGRAVVTYTGTTQGDMTLVSNAFTAQTAPTTARIILDEETAVGSATLDTDLKAYASRDNGTTFTQINLAQQASLDYKTSLLLHCDGANDGVLFPDSSNWQHVPTVSGGTHTDTAVKKFGTASAQFDGTQGDEYLDYPSSPQFGFGTGDWTIDFWVRSPNWSAGSGYGTPFDMRPGSNLAGCPRMFFDTGNSNVPGYTDGTGGTKCGSNVVMVNDTWYHIAVVKYSNVTKVYTNGVTGASGTYPTEYADTTDYKSTNPLRIGDTSVTADPYAFNGYIDEFRITKGMARWTANFTPDTSPYTGTEADRRLISGSVDISGQPSGTNMKYKVTTHNQSVTKITRVYGTSMAWA